jgi:S1-C subfamily serine protease
MCLGEEYIARRYGLSVVHVAVRKQNGDESSASGFFVEDFPGHIATAKHVVQGNRVIQISDRDGREVVFPDQQPLFVADGADVALIPCPIPDGVIPLRIEWDRTEVHELDQVLVLGYPPIARHRPALVHARGEIAALPMRQDAERRSVMISRVTEPGYSGGPVINGRGYVVGVVEQENQLERLDGSPSIFITAAFALHLREIAV